jgi:pimeloyl-ACP methyl ester carboxylesterase
VIDLPGFGLSDEPGRVLNVAEHAGHLADWLEATGLPPVVLLGNSLGCRVAVDLAVRHPDRVRGLILVGPTIDPAARTARMSADFSTGGARTEEDKVGRRR